MSKYSAKWPVKLSWIKFVLFIVAYKSIHLFRSLFILTFSYIIVGLSTQQFTSCEPSPYDISTIKAGMFPSAYKWRESLWKKTLRTWVIQNPAKWNIKILKNKKVGVLFLILHAEEHKIQEFMESCRDMKLIYKNNKNDYNIV